MVVYIIMVLYIWNTSKLRTIIYNFIMIHIIVVLYIKILIYIVRSHNVTQLYRVWTNSNIKLAVKHGISLLSHSVPPGGDIHMHTCMNAERKKPSSYPVCHTLMYNVTVKLWQP